MSGDRFSHLAQNWSRERSLMRTTEGTYGSEKLEIRVSSVRPGRMNRHWWMAEAAVLLALVACAQIPFLSTATPSPSETPDDGDRLAGQIAFIDAIGNVHTIQPDGSQQAAITADAGPQDDSDDVRLYDTIAWSQVSPRLAMTERVEGRIGTLEESVLIADTATGDLRPVFKRTGSSPFYLYWAPHAEALTFLASRIGQFDLELWLWQEGELLSLDRGQPYYWDWSPLGDLIVTHVGGAGEQGRIGRLLGPGQASAAIQSAPGIFQAPAISPDGGQLVISSGAGPSGRLLLLESGGDLLRELANVRRAVAFDWSPDGDQLAFVEQRAPDISGFGELMLLDMRAGGDSRPRGTGIEQVAGFFWSPTGDRIAALTPVINPRGDDRQIRRGSQSSEPRLRIVILDVASGDSRAVTEFVPTAAFLRILPFYDQYQRSSTIWSPDGHALVFTGRRTDGFGGLFVLHLGAEDEVPRLISRAELAFWSFVE